jgi:hypothetical protein
MRTFRNILAMTLAATLLCGCMSIKQEARTTETDPETGIITEHSVSSKVSAMGDAKAIAEKLRGSAGKTATIGLGSASGEANGSTTIKAAGGLIGEAVDAYMKIQTGGASGIINSSN